MDSVKKDNDKSNDIRALPIALSEAIISVYVLIYSLISIVLLGYLLIYHTILINKNLTTKEEMKGLASFYQKYTNIDKGCISNLNYKLFPKTSKNSFVDLLVRKNSLKEENINYLFPINLNSIRDSKLMFEEVILFNYHIN
jgi:hypothetical protein